MKNSDRCQNNLYINNRQKDAIKYLKHLSLRDLPSSRSATGRKNKQLFKTSLPNTDFNEEINFSLSEEGEMWSNIPLCFQLLVH